MRALQVPAAVISIFALGACPSDDPTNPPILWLALDGSETQVRLVDTEPLPF